MNESTKQAIANAATKLFADKGYEGTSVRDIADLAGVNISALNYHYGSKQGLFISLMKELANGRISRAISLLEVPDGYEEFRLRYSMFLQEFATAAVENENLFRVADAHIQFFLEVAPEEFEGTFYKIHQCLVDFLEAAQAKSFIKKGINASLIVHLSLCNLIEAVSEKELFQRFNNMDLTKEEDRKEYITQIVNVLLDGIGA